MILAVGLVQPVGLVNGGVEWGRLGLALVHPYAGLHIEVLRFSLGFGLF